MFIPWLPFEAIVCLRFLREGRMQTLFIMTGVAIGVAVIVFMSALLSGMQANFIHRIQSTQAHIQLVQPQQVTRQLRNTPMAPHGQLQAAIVQPPAQQNKTIDQWQAITQLVAAMSGVRTVSPVISGPLLIVKGSATYAVSVSGIEPESYFKIVDFSDKIVRGGLDLVGAHVLIGTELSSQLGVDVGDPVHMTAADGTTTVLRVSGIFDLSNRSANLRSIYTTLHTGQRLLGLQGRITSLEVTVNDIYAAETIAQHITATTGVEANSWIKANAQFFTAISAQSSANTAIRFFVGLSVAFGIASVLVVAVVQKSREIGILRAMGISQGQILRLFLLQGGLLGFGGAMLGSAIGMLAIDLWQRWALNPDGTPLFALVVDATLFGSAVVLASVTGLVAAFAPALRAARLDPMVAING